jgi:hypothetical protein
MTRGFEKRVFYRGMNEGALTPIAGKSKKE